MASSAWKVPECVPIVLGARGAALTASPVPPWSLARLGGSFSTPGIIAAPKARRERAVGKRCWSARLRRSLPPKKEEEEKKEKEDAPDRRTGSSEGPRETRDTTRDAVVVVAAARAVAKRRTRAKKAKGAKRRAADTAGRRRIRRRSLRARTRSLFATAEWVLSFSSSSPPVEHRRKMRDHCQAALSERVGGTDL
jgi:hypothetical protein